MDDRDFQRRSYDTGRSRLEMVPGSFEADYYGHEELFQGSEQRPTDTGGDFSPGSVALQNTSDSDLRAG
jgi:hypothetical protein